MLVLTRQLNAGDKAAICIGADIEITLVEVRGDQVRIGVQAPRAVSVDRKEIWEQKQKEQKQRERGGELGGCADNGEE